MERDELLSHIGALGRAFVRNDLRNHARRLRVYYLAVSHDLTDPGHKLDVNWTEDFVVEWLSLFGEPGFAHHYERAAGARLCPRCAREPQPETGLPHAAPRTLLVFPGGAKLQCLACLYAWVCPDPSGSHSREAGLVSPGDAAADHSSQSEHGTGLGPSARGQIQRR